MGTIGVGAPSGGLRPEALAGELGPAAWYENPFVRKRH